MGLFTKQQIQACVNQEGCSWGEAQAILAHNKGFLVPYFDKLPTGTLMTTAGKNKKRQYSAMIVSQTDKNYICVDWKGNKRRECWINPDDYDLVPKP